MLTLLGASASPFVRKVRVFLAEKGIPYDQKVLIERNVKEKVPPILDYLGGEDRFATARGVA